MSTRLNKIYLKTGLLVFLFLHSALIGTSRNTPVNNTKGFLKNRPVLFIENKGQLTDFDGNQVPFVLFSVQTTGVNLYITEKGLTYTLLENLIEKNKKDAKKTDWNRVDMLLKDANIKKENIIAEGKSSSFNQYFLGHCQNGITDVHSYEKITIKNIYPNIDWVLYNSTDKGFKYDFIVHPAGDAKKIKMNYISKNPITINENGELEISNSLGNIHERAPVSFLNQAEVKTRFIQTQAKIIKINSDIGYESTISFDFIKSTVSHLTSDLVIDPQLVWGTFFGDLSSEYSTSIATDLNGNVCISGNTNSLNFPVQSGGGYFQGTHAGGTSDLFILKFTNNGALLWSTYYGGSGIDNGNSITADATGNIFVTGTTTSSDFPVLNAGTYFQGTYSDAVGGWDMYILKFNSNGNRLWATYYGGEYVDIASSIITDLNGNVFITGYTTSPNFPTLDAGTHFQGVNFAYDDVLLLKFDNTGNRLWATFYGGTHGDRGLAITTDIFGNIFVTGHTDSDDLPVINTGGTTFFQPFSGPNTSQLDLFITKFSNNGTLLWGTHYGGIYHDIGFSIITDQWGNLFVSGRTESNNFPVLNAGGNSYFQGASGGQSDFFILKFDNIGTRLWATYYGGTDSELNFTSNYSYDKMIAIDGCGNLYCSFDTKSNNLVTKSHCNAGYIDNSLTGTSDYFISMFTNTGESLWATYLGGDGNDMGTHVALDASNNLFFTGGSFSVINNTSYPLISNGAAYFDGSYNNASDVYISKFKSSSSNNTMTQTNPTNCQCNGTASVSVSGCPPFNYYWSNGVSVLNSTLTTSSISGLCPGVYQATVTSNCDTYTPLVNLVNTQTLVATLNPSDSIRCNPSSVSLVSSSDASTYSWAGPGIISGANTATAVVNIAGTYSLNVTDANGCTSSTTTDIYQSSNTADIICAVNGMITCVQPSANLESYSETPLITYTWIPTNANSSSVTVTSGGTYTLLVTNPTNGCISFCTTNVMQNSTAPSVNAFNSTTLTCTVIEATLTGSGSGNYLWTGANIISGATSANPVVNAPGIYTLTITDQSNGCVASATTTVTQQVLMPVVTISNSDTLTCLKDNGTLSGSGIGSYLWSGPGIVSGGNTDQPTVNEPGVYTLSVTNSQGCTTTATTQVTHALDTPTLIVSSNVTLSVGEETTIFAEGTSNFTWLPNQGISCLTCIGAVVAPTANTSYCAQTSLGSCTTRKCVSIFIKDLCSEDMSYSVPNALSPNGDGVNDQFCLYGWENCVKSFYIAIYDRWGEKMFESSEPDFCWDGKYKGKILAPDVFMYYIKADIRNNSKLNKTGDVTLIR